MPTQINSELARILLWAADLVAQEARSLGKTTRIRDSIKVSTVEEVGNTYQITVSISTKDAPEALAYEFGSGIWGERGERYPIVPKEASILSFEWREAASIAQREGVDKVNFGENGRVFLPGVLHPGVRKEPYMQPALDKHKDEIVGTAADRSVTLFADLSVVEETIIA